LDLETTENPYMYYLNAQLDNFTVILESFHQIHPDDYSKKTQIDGVWQASYGYNPMIFL
jgi:hypothetical protein